jgi:hypothetical protein
MKKSVLKAAAIAGFSVLGASGAFAQSATQTITLNAFVNAKCLIDTLAAGTETVTVTTTGTATGSNGTTGTAQNLTLQNGGSYALACSTPNTITLTSQFDGLKANTPGAGANVINYTATVQTGGALGLTQALTTLGTGTQKQVVSAVSAAAVAAGTMTIGIAVPAQPGLSPGTYQDTLTVLITPQ